jgi:septum site-determining protein MinC
MVPVAVTQAEDETRSRAAAAGFGYVAPTVPRAAGRTNGPGQTNGGAPASTTAVSEAPALAQMAAAAAEPRPAPLASDAAPVAATSTAAPAPEEKTPAPTVATPPPRLLSHRPPVVIRQPVRSGQIIYAEATDLVILAPVNPGAEVVADGHVHIYATLRGRAVAGAQGMTDARIFCQKLEAELVAISGAYLLSDDIPIDRRGKPAQIHLEDGVCRVTPL